MSSPSSASGHGWQCCLVPVWVSAWSSGVAEPLSHYLRPPRSRGVPALTDAAANQAMALTVFHWGLHAWAIYVVVGLGMAYMTYRRGRPCRCAGCWSRSWVGAV